MDSVASWSPKDRKELFELTETKRGIPAALIEKDFWVCWILDKIFTNKDLSKGIVFKGGTTLSKVFNVIERFSEDIDLIIDWKELNTESPHKERSNKKQSKFIAELREAARIYIEKQFFPALNSLIGSTCEVSINRNKPLDIDIRYPVSFPVSSKENKYNRYEILLETGPIAESEPYDSFTITSYAAEEFPDKFNKSKIQVQSLKAERTFWEKATILHVEAHRSKDKVVPERYSRHYYDMMLLANSEIKNRAFADISLLERVVRFKNKFYHSAWANYQTAVIGSFKLVPPEHVRVSLKKDYDDMKIMIFGKTPTFDEIMDSVEILETEINQL